jgi:predicted nucleotidyltransferase
MNLTPDEQTWLDAYCQGLAEQFPNLVEEIVVFGSKARGDARPDSDLDILVIVREADRITKREVGMIGHRLAVESEAVPSIRVYTREEWSRRQHHDSPLYRAVVRDGVRVA